jgi:hypothetical protein
VPVRFSSANRRMVSSGEMSIMMMLMLPIRGATSMSCRLSFMNMGFCMACMLATE